MGWNVWLTEWLMARSGTTMLLWIVLSLLVVLSVMIVLIEMLKALDRSMHKREWVEHASAVLLMHMHQYEIQKISFDCCWPDRVTSMRIRGPHVWFDWRPNQIGFPWKGEMIAALFVDHPDRKSLCMLMRRMRELADVNGSWLDYREGGGHLEFLRSAEIIPFRQVA